MTYRLPCGFNVFKAQFVVISPTGGNHNNKKHLFYWFHTHIILVYVCVCKCMPHSLLYAIVKIVRDSLIGRFDLFSEFGETEMNGCNA